MAPSAKGRKSRSSRVSGPERPVIWRGIKIAPMTGRRSPLARAIREGLRIRSEQARGEDAQT